MQMRCHICMIRAVKQFFLLASVLLLAGCKVKLDIKSFRLLHAGSLRLSPRGAGSRSAGSRGRRSAGPLRRRPEAVYRPGRGSSDGGPEVIAELAFDNNPSSRWSSVFSDNQWVEAYFDRPVGVKKIDILWETARAADFSIQLLNRQTNWVEVGRRTDASGPSDALSFSRPINALGIRIQCDRRATEWGNSIYEVYVSGVTKGTPPPQNLTKFRGQPTAWQLYGRGNAEKLLAEAAADPQTSAGLTDDQFLDLVAKRSFYYFWYETNPTNGLTRDRGRNFKSSEDANLASVAAVGFALTAYAIGAERGWVARRRGAGADAHHAAHVRERPDAQRQRILPAFREHFSGADSPDTEISTIDTALFLAGMITAMEYFQDAEISELARKIFERVDWDWARNGNPNFVSHGLDPKGNFMDKYWGSTTEGILIYLLALGSPTHPLPVASWDAIDQHTGEYEGFTFVGEYGFQSMFPYQYPALWYDFRGQTDRSGVDYFENATLAVLAMRQYCILNANNFPGSYGPDLWGQGAADGPGDRYMIYGFPPGDPYSPIDGTVVPYAIGGSVPFLPQHSIRALRYLYDTHHEVWGKYGFADSINPNQSFVARDALASTPARSCSASRTTARSSSGSCS